MKPSTIDISVLLIQAPMHHPACWPRRGEAAVSDLASIVRNLIVFDAGLDFFHKVLMNQDFLQRMARRVESSRSPGAGDIEIGPGVHRPVWPGISSAWERLQSAAWSRPEDFVGDLKALDSALDLVSAAYFPGRFSRNGFAHPGLNTIDDLVAFRDDPEANPFWPYAFEQWQPFSMPSAPDAAVIYIATAGQIPAAATLVHAWRLRWPEIPLLAAGPDGLTAQAINELFFEARPPVCADDVRRLGVHLRTMDIEGAAGHSRENSVRGPEGRPTMRRAPLQRPLAADQMPAFARQAVSEGRKLIIWKSGNQDVDAIARQMHAVARLGIWNHLVLDDGSSADLEKFALTNANIVHSWCRQESVLSPFSDPGCRYPDVAPGYGETVPMPGKPLWMVFRDPVYIEAALERFDMKALMRMRIGDDGCSLFEVGQNLHYHFVPPKDLPAGYLDEIVRMVAAGGSVQTQFVKHNLERAHLIAYVEEAGVIIGNSSLKHPRDEYIEAVSRQSGIDLHNFLERGYTSVRPEYRGLGIGAKLLAGLTERAGGYKIFSVIAEGNIATQKMAIRNRTRRVATFFSQRARKDVGVWIPEWMLPEGIQLPEQPDV